MRPPPWRRGPGSATRAAGLRRRLIVAALGAVGLGLAALTLGFVAILSGRLSADADNVLRSRASAALANLAVTKGRLTVEDTPSDATLDQRVWVFDNRRPIELPPASPDLQDAVARLRATPDRTFKDAPGDTRLLAVPAVIGGRRVGTIVAAVSLVPYRHTERIALIAALVLAAAVMVGVAILARRTVTVALRPVAEMTAQATDWSEHDLDKRFGLGPPRDELTALAATLDALLGRLSASLRHEQRFSAEVAHELRTPLAALRTDAEVALRHQRSPDELRAVLESVIRQTERMGAVVDTLVTAAQEQADARRGTVDAYEAATLAAETCSALAAERNMTIDVLQPAHPIEVDADRDLTTQILAPLLDNGVRYGRARVELAIRPDRGSVLFEVRDDGPGVGAEEAGHVFEPGVRGKGADGQPGAGLGLALAQRLARSTGGDVVVEPADRPAGACFVVRLPAS